MSDPTQILPDDFDKETYQRQADILIHIAIRVARMTNPEIARYLGYTSGSPSGNLYACQIGKAFNLKLRVEQLYRLLKAFGAIPNYPIADEYDSAFLQIRCDIHHPYLIDLPPPIKNNDGAIISWRNIPVKPPTLQQYLDNMELTSFLPVNVARPLGYRTSINFLFQLISALKILYEKKIAMININYKNVFMNSDRVVGKQNLILGALEPINIDTGRYMVEFAAPELFDDDFNDLLKRARVAGASEADKDELFERQKKIDVWSLGVLTYRLVVSQLPYIDGYWHRDKNFNLIFEKDGKTKIPHLMTHATSKSKFLSDHFNENPKTHYILESMLEPDFKKRIALNDIIYQFK